MFSIDHARVSAASLLGRSAGQVHDEPARRLIRGKRLLVTGAGGSIGSELARQLTALEPQSLHLLDHDENALHSLQLEFCGHGLLDHDKTILADIRDPQAINRSFSLARPEVVFHAAAHKHLPLLERYPSEALRTNVVGTANVVQAAVTHGTGIFVNISTDKAASPTSVLGATKRIAEMVVASHAGLGMRVASVRFGNVLGSQGSFLRSLAYQVGHGLPVTVTHPDVTRFFMTIPEASGLVIEAALMADRGEVYVLDMGEPVRILDLVERFSAAVGHDQPEVAFTGLRPGEKLHEELLDTEEIRSTTQHDRIWRVTTDQSAARHTSLRALDVAATADVQDPATLRASIFSLLSRSCASFVTGERTVASLPSAGERVA